MKLIFLTVVVTILVSFSDGQNLVAPGATRRLLETLFSKTYDNSIIPAERVKKPLLINVGIHLIFIDQVDEEKGTFSINVNLKQKWRDFRLQWDPKNFDQVSDIIIPSKKIWLPDLGLYNGHIEMERDFKKVIVLPDGNVTWVEPMKFIFYCGENSSLSMSLGEDRVCIGEIGSWTYDSELIDLETGPNKLEINNFVKVHPQWELIESGIKMKRLAKYYPCCKHPYVSVEFWFPLKHKSSAIDGWQKSMAFPCTIVILLAIWATIKNSLAKSTVRTAVGLLLLFLSGITVFSCALTKTSVFSSKAGILVISTTFIVLFHVLVASIISSLSLGSFLCTSKLATKLLTAPVKRIFIPSHLDETDDENDKESEDERDLKRIFITFVSIIHVLIFVVIMAVFAS